MFWVDAELGSDVYLDGKSFWNDTVWLCPSGYEIGGGNTLNLFVLVKQASLFSNYWSDRFNLRGTMHFGGDFKLLNKTLINLKRQHSCL